MSLTPRLDDQAVLIMKTVPSSDDLAARYREVRATTERLCAPLETEDYVVQSMPDASPAKWHLAHTTWFFETFVLAAGSPTAGRAIAEVRLPLQFLLQRPRRADRPGRAAGCSRGRRSPRSTATARRSTRGCADSLGPADEPTLAAARARSSCSGCTTSSSTRS